MSLDIAGRQSLDSVRDLMTSIADIDFFIKLSDSALNCSDDELARIIKASHYSRVKQEREELKGRRHKWLENLEQDLQRKKLQFEEAKRQVEKSEKSESRMNTVLQIGANHHKQIICPKYLAKCV